MKKILYLSLPLILIFTSSFMLAGCATTLSAANTKRNNANSKTLRFDYWKYKGFGSELPLWIEHAIDGKIDAIGKTVPELYGRELLIFTGKGVNSDQAERNLESDSKSISESFKLYDEFWVHIADKKNKHEPRYIAVAIYYK